jgi:hypothetical protein
MYLGAGRGDNLWITLLGHPHGGLAPHKKHSGCVSQNITGDVLYVVFFGVTESGRCLGPVL